MTGAGDLVLRNGKITTLDPAVGEAEALAIRDGRVLAVGTAEEIMPAVPGAQVIDLGGRRVIPGLNDSHTHLIRGGLNYNMELRWENVPSLADALRLLKLQADRTPAPQWVRVVGGWSELQFAERRMPTLDEINAAAPNTPAFILHLYSGALLNRAALRVLGFGRDTPDPPGGRIERDARGEPTGLLIAKPSALILYSTLARGPTLPFADQLNSTRQFMRELNRLGVTSVIDAGGGGQNYPDDYAVIERLHAEGQLTVRIAYNLFAQKAGAELSDYERWVAMTEPGAGDAFLRMNGAGENLAWSAADFENFLEPRPDLAPTWRRSSSRSSSSWPGSAGRSASTRPMTRASTASSASIERVTGERALPDPLHHRPRRDGQPRQHRPDRGARRRHRHPAPHGLPGRVLRRALRARRRRGDAARGADAARGRARRRRHRCHARRLLRPLGGALLADHRQDRRRPVALWRGEPARSRDGLAPLHQGLRLVLGRGRRQGHARARPYADLAVLSADYLTVPAEEIRAITSDLTIVGGRIVHAAGGFGSLAPPLPPASPSWSPVGAVPTPAMRSAAAATPRFARACADGCGNSCTMHGHDHRIAWATPLPTRDRRAFWGALGCSCFAV